jgi:hypothetical protein
MSVRKRLKDHLADTDASFWRGMTAVAGLMTALFIWNFAQPAPSVWSWALVYRSGAALPGAVVATAAAIYCLKRARSITAAAPK